MEMDHMQNKGQQTHMAILLCSNGLQVFFSLVILIFDIGHTGVNDADMKNDS